MKKLLVVTLALMMTLGIAACQGKKTPSSSATTASTSAPAPESKSSVETEIKAVTESTAVTETSAATETSEAPESDTEKLVYTLDYQTIAEWVDAGYIGTDESGSPVVMAIDETNETAIIIFGDNSDMTAASFVGAITYTDTTGTITDEANESSLTFGVTQVSEDSLELDMGDIGKTTIKAAEKETVLESIKNAIDNYEHVA